MSAAAQQGRKPGAFLDIAYVLQMVVSISLAVSFYVLMLIASPDDKLVMLTATLGFILAPIVARRLGEASKSVGQEPIFVMLGAYLCVLLPASLTPPIRELQWPALALGVLAVEALWAVHRYPKVPRTRSPVLTRVKSSVVMALMIAGGVSVMAAIVVIIGAVGDPKFRSGAPSLLLVIIAGYFAGACAAGTLVGLLRPISQWPLGTMLLGILGGILVYGAISPAVQIVSAMEGRSVMTFADQVWVSIACGVVGGPPAALGLKYGGFV